MYLKVQYHLKFNFEDGDAVEAYSCVDADSGISLDEQYTTVDE